MDQNIINHQSLNLLCNTVGGNLKTAVMFLLLKGIKFLHLWTIWKLNIHFVFYLSFFKASLPLLACSIKFVCMYWLCLLKAHNHLWERLAMFAYGKSETTSTAANIFTTYTQEGSGSDEKRCQRICVCTLIYTIMMAMMHCVYLLHDFRAFQMHYCEVLALLRAWFVSSTSVTSLWLCKEAPELWTEVIYFCRTFICNQLKWFQNENLFEVKWFFW